MGTLFFFFTGFSLTSVILQNKTSVSCYMGINWNFVDYNVDAHLLTRDLLYIFHVNWQLADSGVYTIPKDVRKKHELFTSSLPDIWNDLITKLGSETLCIKPARDGCSTGVARLRYYALFWLRVVIIISRHLIPNNLGGEHGFCSTPIDYVKDKVININVVVPNFLPHSFLYSSTSILCCEPYLFTISLEGLSSACPYHHKQFSQI